MKRLLFIGVIASALIVMRTSRGSVLTFDDAITGAVSYAFDSDGDAVNDVIFSTTDPLGFNTVGPGPNMSYINEPGLEGTALLTPDLRVDFLNGAFGSLAFGFALDTFDETSLMNFSVYDSGGALLASASVPGLFTSTPGGKSTFPEGRVDVSFAGKAAYALFDATGTEPRYIVDNFEGTFGSTEVPVGTPDAGSTLCLLSLGWLCLAVLKRSRS